ncbi:MAG: nuclease [Polyangiaceae bacterium]|nr:nuclease [Polyangiaceae bacterium]
MREMTSRCVWRSCLFGAALALVAPQARAWGDDGHRAVGELAYRYLSLEARAALAEALTEPGYETLAEAATWPDTHARRFPEYDPMKPFHYVNVDARAPSYYRPRDCENGCVVTVLEQHLALLGSADPPLTLSERRRSVYWIAHLMGDLHQPLHVAHPDARGGSRTMLRFFEAKDLRNAHWIWDSGLIERRPPPSSKTRDAVATDQPAYRALTDELAAELTGQKVREYQRALSPEAIANECLALSKRYAYLTGADHVDAAYEKSRWPVVKQQLQRAGVRLAAVLERALGKRR